MFTDESPHATVIRDRRNPAGGECLPRSAQRAIRRLLKASKYAADTGRDAWEFAITLAELRRDGIAENELRWLVCRGYIEHAEEITTTGDERAFDHRVSLRFSRQSAFVITSAGLGFSRKFLNSFTRREVRGEVGPSSMEAARSRAKFQPIGNALQEANGNARPKWDRDRRELRIGNNLVKVFKLPSPMQEAILMAFEEENWPPRIDDPLPGHPDHLPKRRLHDTIKSLNRNQKKCLIRFMGDGTGEGIRWELISSSDDADHLNVLLH